MSAIVGGLISHTLRTALAARGEKSVCIRRNAASRLAALLDAQIRQVFPRFAPCDPGASSASVRRRTFTTDYQPQQDQAAFLQLAVRDT